MAGWVADLSYVGNLTRKLPVALNQNFIPANELNNLPVAQRPAYFNAQVPNPMAGLLPGSAFNGANIPRQQTLMAYPHFSQVSISNIPIGGQSYHSLQVKGTRRYANGLSAQVSYTWGKTLERVTALNRAGCTPRQPPQHPARTAPPTVGHSPYLRRRYHL
jgi:hypothetical protein